MNLQYRIIIFNKIFTKYINNCMSKFRNVFTRVLLKEANGDLESPESPEKRPRFDRNQDRESFEGSLDSDTDPDFLDTEGLSQEALSKVDDTTEQIISWSDEIESFTNRLVDPQNPDALLTKLASVVEIPEFATAAEAVSKHLKKAVAEIRSAKTELDVLSSLAGSRRDQRRKQDSATAGASGPY